MKKLFLIIIGLCLCTALYADMNTYIIGTVSAGGASCSETADVSFETTVSALNIGTSDQQMVGQTITPAHTGNVCSVAVYLAYATGSCTITLRIKDNSTDLTSDYVETTLAVDADDSATWIVFDLPTSVAVSTAHTFTIAMQHDGTYGNFKWGRNPSGDYAGGQVVLSGSNGSWNLTDTSSSSDAGFRIFLEE